MVKDITMTELKKIVAETSVSVKELSESQHEVKKTLKELAEAQKNTELALQETQRVVQETRLDMQDMRRDMQETRRDFNKMLAELSGNVGGVNQRLGEIVELVVLPGLMKGMNDFGHKFTMSSPRKKYSKNGKQLAEVDLLLENCDEVMVVEVKARFKAGEMNDFLNQLELLRKHEKITGMAGKKIFAAAAGIGFDPQARKIAAGKGIYLVNIDTDYDNEKLKITPPPKGKAGKW